MCLNLSKQNGCLSLGTLSPCDHAFREGGREREREAVIGMTPKERLNAVVDSDGSVSAMAARSLHRRSLAARKGMHGKGEGMHKGHRGMRRWKPASTINSKFIRDRFSAAYNEWNAYKVPPSGVTITYDGSSSRVHSWSSYGYGVYTADIKTPSGNTDGLIMGFYLSSSTPYKGLTWEDPLRDEIDLEWVGNNHTIVQTNYLTNGVGVSKHEYWGKVPFDHSTRFHTYRIVYLPGRIEWQVDNYLLRRLTPEGWRPIPKKPMYLYFSIWASWEVPENVGLLNWAGRYNGKFAPYKLEFSNIYVPKGKA